MTIHVSAPNQVGHVIIIITIIIIIILEIAVCFLWPACDEIYPYQLVISLCELEHNIRLCSTETQSLVLQLSLSLSL